MVGIPAAGKTHPANLALMHGRDGLDDPWPTPALVAHLHHAPVLPGGGHDQFALVQIVAAGFFHVNMFAGGATEDGGGRVPVVGCGNGNGVNIAVFQEAAQISFTLGRARLFFGDSGQAFFQGAPVHVTNAADLGVGQRHKTFDDVHAAGVAADDRHNHLFIGAAGGAGSPWRGPRSQAHG